MARVPAELSVTASDRPAPAQALAAAADPARPAGILAFKPGQRDAVPQSDMAPAIHLDNIVPFMRPARGREPLEPVVLAAADRPAPPRRLGGSWQLVLLLAGSLTAHAGLLMFFDRPPPALASIGQQSISVEIVLGGQTHAGTATVPNEATAPVNAAPAPDQGEEVASPQQMREAKTVPAAPQDAPSELAETPPAPELRAPEPVPTAPPVAASAPDAPVAATTPPPEQVLTAPNGREAVPLPPRPPERAKTEPKPAPKKPVDPAKRPAKHRTAAIGPDPREVRSRASTAALASNGIGIGRSDTNSNYRGLVLAHLTRHKQYPADARSRGDTGRVTVAFTLDGNGRVTSARIVNRSGVASLDQEAQAMVRRASPFPAPPNGRAQSFTAPVNFNIR